MTEMFFANVSAELFQANFNLPESIVCGEIHPNFSPSPPKFHQQFSDSKKMYIFRDVLETDTTPPWEKKSGFQRANLQRQCANLQRVGRCKLVRWHCKLARWRCKLAH